jgi:hypothetical protein
LRNITTAKTNEIEDEDANLGVLAASGAEPVKNFDKIDVEEPPRSLRFVTGDREQQYGERKRRETGRQTTVGWAEEAR